MGILYVVATPIGNLEDMTLRAMRILREVDLILCEDTRVSQKLLQHFEIKKPLLSYHQHSRLQRIDEVIKKINDGQNIALVTDAGTPGVSDPGNVLVREVIERCGPEAEIISIPGVSAVTSAASIAGLPSDRFLFLGFLPHKKGKETLLKRIAESTETVIFYESPHRILKTLQKLNAIVSPDRKVVVLRELTKKFEQRVGETIEECLDYFEKHQDKIKGEFAVVVGGKKQ